MKLSITERLLLGSVFLPETGGFIELLGIQGIKDKVQFTSDEIQEFELKDTSDGGVYWNPIKDKEIYFPFSESEKSILKTAFSKHDNEKTIRMDMMSLCKKINEL